MTQVYGNGGDFDKEIIVYVDGCCINNGQPDAKAGVGICFPDYPKLNVGETMRHSIPCTNSNAEIVAARRALEIAHDAGFLALLVYTDSEFLVNAMNFEMQTWQSSGWKKRDGSQVVNKDELLKLLEACNQLARVRFAHVPGHSGNEGNETADMLAKQGAARY